jgi:hypothetical protein
MGTRSLATGASLLAVVTSGEAESAVQADHFAVEVVVLADVLDQGGVLGRKMG